jgi:thiamine-phosphate pyrophosphorylase
MHKKYSNVFYFVDSLNKQNIQNLNKNISIIFRDYKHKLNIKKLIDFRNFCRSSGRKFYLANNPKIAYSLDLDGVYVPAFNKKINLIPINNRKKFIILGSAHNLSEIKIKEIQKCEFIFITPVFKVDKKKQFLGIYRYNQLVNLTKHKTIALGGINSANFKRLKLIKSEGFASISYIKKNGLK